jgi:hypothetical protein
MSVSTVEVAPSIQKCANVVCINGLQRNKYNHEIKATRNGFCSYCWTEIPTVVKTQIHFKFYKVSTMSDGTYRFENYPHSFDGIIDCIKWGRAYEAALDAEAKAKLDLEDLMREVGIYN